MTPFTPFSLNLRGRLAEYSKPAVMGVINATPDSFHAPSRGSTGSEAARMAERMAAEGADIIDIGGCSTRPGSTPPSAAEELARLRVVIPEVRRATGADMPLSVDTWRAGVARGAVEELGADMVNDISCLGLDPAMAATVAALGVPYVLMHMRGTPADMQQHTRYTDPADPTPDVIAELEAQYSRLCLAGVADIIIDPGIGFAKTTQQNYALLRQLPAFRRAFPGAPLLVGLSRKSMLTGPLSITPDRALPATIAASTLAMAQGAQLLRVHDVAAAVQARDVYCLTVTP